MLLLSSSEKPTCSEKTIYFSSDRQGGLGGRDIYYAQLMPDGSWGNVKNMGPQINTKFDEDAPFVHSDGKTLFFASTGHNTIGGYDIFVSEKVAGQWSKPVNLGYPINTPYDDFFFASTANGKFAYNSSNRAGGSGGYDIYKVTFWGPEKAPITDMEDYLLASRAQPMKDAQVEGTVEVNKKSFTVFKGITVDALKSRPFRQALEIANYVKSINRLGEFVIIHLGTNNFVDQQTLDEIMVPLKDVDLVLFVTAHVPTRKWQDPNNALVRAMPNLYGNVRVLDWYQVAVEHPEYLYGDKVHLNNEGQKVYADLIMQAIGK
jgi:hypothetical protein